VKPVTEKNLLMAIETAWARFDESQTLRQALVTGEVVERAKGVLMARLNLTQARAHDWLRARIRERRMAVSEFAKRILEAVEERRPLPGTPEAT
jgi:response regulator NasT